MNQFNDPASDTASDTRFDRLVDGELNEAERRQMLASLDDEPGGWRECAMAFLEAQAWKQGMHAFRDGDGGDPLQEALQTLPLGAAGDTVSPSPRTLNSPHSSSHEKQPDDDSGRPGYVGLALAMVACFLVAFFLGTEFRQRWSSTSPTPKPLVQGQTPTRPEFPDAPEVVDQGPPPGNESPGNESPGNESPGNESPRNESPVATSRVIPWGAATFVMDGHEGRELDVPVFDLDPNARQVFLETSTAPMENLSQQLQRAGFEVQRNVRWSPVEMGDGQHMFVPISDFEIKPRSRPTIP